MLKTDIKYNHHDLYKMAQIIHISDIHIDIRTTERAKVYEHVFKNFINMISGFDPKSTVIVIAGDIFHHKDTLSSEDIKIFKSFLHNIRKYKVIIIPGNHDASINNPDFCSITSSILLNPDNSNLFQNVRYSENTEFFDIPIGDNSSDNLLQPKKLKFFHLSIYDKRNKEQIEDFFLQNKSLLSQCIFLYHGSVEGVDKYYSLNSRISQKVLEIPKLTILGDYHQFRVILKDKVAYSGCLLGRTLGDGIKKGFILWKLQGQETVTEQFIEIPNRYEPKKEDISSLTLREARQKLKTIESHGNVYLIVNSQQSSELSKEAKLKNVKLVPFVPRKNFKKIFIDQVQLIQQILVDQPPEIVKKVISLHLQVFKEPQGHTFSKITLSKLKFDNLFRYGKNNFIDFEKLHGVSCIVGRNNTGKSSILRILLYTLFREVEEGSSLSDVINQSEKKATVSLSFSLESDTDTEKYQIVCSITKTKTEVKFFKINPDNTQEDISGKDLTSTYKIIEQKIGSYKDFLLTSMQMQDTKFDIVKNKNFLKESVQHLTHMSESDIKQIEKNIEKEIDQLEAQIVPLKEYKQKLKQQLQEIKKNLELLRTEITIKTSKKEDLISSLQKKTQELEKARQEYSLCEAQLATDENSYEIKQLESQVKTLLAQEEKRFQKVIAHPMTRPISSYYREIYRYGYEYDQHCDYESIIEILSELQKFKNKIPLVVQIIKDERLLKILKAKDEIKKRLYETVEKISRLEKELSGETYESLLEKKGRLKEGLEFDLNCEKCRNNKKILKINYTRPEIEAKLEQYKLLGTLRKQREQFSEDLTKVSDITEDEFQKVTGLLRYSGVIMDIYDRKTRLLKPLELEEMTKCLSKIEALKRKNQEHKIRIDEALKRIQYTINHLTSEVKTIQEQLELLTREIATSEKSVVTFEKMAEKCVNELLETQNKKSSLKEEVLVRQLYGKKVLKKLPELATKRVIEDLVTEVNNLTLLTCDFSIKLEEDYKIRIVGSQNNIETNIPFALASGFQKFVVSLIFRVCLTSMFPRTGDFLIIDEGFGCLDNENCNKVVEFLEYIKDKYKFILVITHIEKMKSLIDNQINIISDGSYSRVNY